MTLGPTLIVAFAGFMVATFVFAVLARWAALVHAAYGQAAILVPTNPIPKTIVLVFCQSPFHGAPWTLLVMGFVACHIRSEPWAPWLLGGFAAGVAYMGLVVAVAVRRMRRP